MKKNIVLKGTRVYSEIQEVQPENNPRMDKNNKEYWLMSFAGTAFTMRKPEYDAWAGHEIQEITLTESTRQVQATDPTSGEPIAGEFNTVTAYQFTGKLNYDAAETVAKNEANILGVKLSVAREYKLNPVEISALLGLDMNIQSKPEVVADMPAKEAVAAN